MNRFKNASNNKYFKYIINELKAKYDELILSDTDITDELFDIFYRTGSRLEYENVYFRKRTLLTASAVLYFIYGEKNYYDTMISVMRSVSAART